MSATSGGGGSVSEGSEAGGSSQSTMSVSDSPSTSFQTNLAENVTKITLSEENSTGGYGADLTGSKINLSLDERHPKDGIVNVAFDFEEGGSHGGGLSLTGSGGEGVVMTGGAGGGVGMSGGTDGGVGSNIGTGGGVGIGGGTGGGGGNVGGVAVSGGSGIGIGVSGGGSAEFKSINGSEKKDKIPEAVNLELVNMVPYSNGNGTSYGVPVNGIPVKKDSEQVDMSSPYDEYFVPVNEHKKYMRGEKLYVTKDKRRPTSWRRCLSWVVACTVISVVLIVAILAGTGVILSEPNSVKEASVGRNFAGSNVNPSVTDKSPTAEMYMYVPRSIESEFVIDNLNFDPALKDTNSTTYQKFVASMEDHLKMLLFSKETLEFGASDVALKVVNISRDPFKVNYRIGWNYKQGVNNPPEPIKMEDVKKRLVESLARNQGYIDKYHIDREAIKVNHVVDTCQTENGGCSHICYYNYITQQFTCTCPTHLVLDNSGKNCVAWSGSSEDDAVPVPSQTAYPEMPYESTAKPVLEQNFDAGHEHGVHQGIKHNQEDENEPTPEPEPNDHEPAVEPESTPEPSPDHGDESFYSKSKKKIIHSPYDAHDYGDTSQPATENDSEDKFIHGSKEPEAEPTPEPAPEPAAEPNSEGRDHIASWQETRDHESSPEPTPEPAPEPVSQDSSKGRSHDHDDHSIHDHDDHSVHDFKDDEPAAEPTPEPVLNSTPVESILEGKAHDHAHQSLYGSKNQEPATSEPSPSFKAEGNDHDQGHHRSAYGFKEEQTGEPAPEPIAEENERDHEGGERYVHESKDHEPAAEPTPEPAPEPIAEENEKDQEGGERYVHESKDHEPAAEPTPEPAPKPTPDTNPEEDRHETDIHFAHVNEDREPAPESSTEPYSEPTAEPSAEPTAEPSAEPTAEPSPEGKDHDQNARENVGKDADHVGHSELGSKEGEPTAEPTPATVTESVSKEGNIYGTSFHSAHEETVAEPTAEPAPEGSNNDDDSVKISKGHEAAPEPTPEPGTDFTHSHDFKEHPADKELNEPVEEPTPEPSIVDDSVTRFNSDTGQHFDTMIHSPAAHENTNSKPSGDSHESVPFQDQTTETKTEYSAEGMQTGSAVKKSEHHAPHLEDILIRKAAKNPEHQNGTRESQNVLDNVELKANGEPVIEEVIIDKFGSHLNHESDSANNPVLSEGTDKAGVHENNDTMRFFPTGPHQSLNNERGTVQYDTSTDHPKIVEYSTVEHSTESDKKGSETPTQSGSEKSTLEHTTLGYSANGNGGEAEVQDNSKDKSSTLGNKKSTNQSENVGTESISTTKTNEGVPVTTIHPEIEHEPHTIPVAIEFLHPIEGNFEENQTNAPKVVEENPQSNTQAPDVGASDNTSKPEENRGNEQSKILTDNGSIQTGIRELATESHTPMTTSLPVPTSEEINSHVSRGDSKETGNIKQNQSEFGETTKSPEELSNNIKDEIPDNEEFNTLIDHEYKNKEDGPNESTKYPNKPLKTEKKKIKDYVKGDKIDQKGEATPKTAVTPAEFILQKHVNGNENIFDLDYSLNNEHTTKHDDGVTIVDAHGIEVPGVSFKPHGINNHDIRVLQTVAPDFRTETLVTDGAQDTVRADSKSKEGEFKQDKDYSKFDKDYKYEKQKVSKKKDLKKKVSGKDGKNVELDDGRKYVTEMKDELDLSSEEMPETTVNAFERITVEPEGVRNSPEGAQTFTTDSETKTEHEHQAKGQSDPEENEQSTIGPHENQHKHVVSVDKSGHLMIDEPDVKSTSGDSSETVSDRHVPTVLNFTIPEMTHKIMNYSETLETDQGTPGTVFDGMTQVSGPRFEINGGGKNSSFVIYENTEPKIVSDGKLVPGMVNSTIIHPTIIVNGENDNIQVGHTVRFRNSTFFKPGNATLMSILNGTLNHPEGHSFSYFPNGSAVNPTIVVRGQSGALQGGHEIKFGNVTYRTVLSPETHATSFKDSNVYRIENQSLPGTVFDGHFNPQEGHYHMFTNSSGMFVYTNASTQPAFVVRGQSGGDFVNPTGYAIRNSTNSFSNGFATPHSVIFRNSTVFAVGDAQVPEHPEQPTSNETIHYSHQMSPSFVSSKTSYKVNDYFSYISKCASGQFQCLNGTSKRGSACISLSSKCDSINDCSDGSDELGCIENGCPGNFQCSDNTCLKRNLVCNGILDCSDGSDEKNCENWKCEFDEFQCPSGRCIPVVWQCDSKPDCENHTDEYNCQTSCGNDEYLCPEGWCIPLTYKCNGVKDCSNGEDEQLCDCSHDEFKCQTGGCVSMSQVCNGLEDCPDRSDEWDCVKLEPESNLLKIRSATGNYEPVCADNWSTQHSDGVCASLGYFSSVPNENENNSSITTETSFYVLKNDTTADFSKKIIVNLRKANGNCSSGKFVEISCQEFGCGSRSMTDSSSVEARLVGGMSATAGQWPSVALLYNVRNFHSCTANVLTPRWVLASYNCLKMGNKNLNEQDWKFFGGSTVFEAERENAETRKILSIIPHPQVKFNQFLFSNDLALVELDQSLQFTTNLGAVCLPEQEIQPRQICVTAGWGMNNPEDKAIRQQLQYLPVPTMNLTECNSTEHYSGFITDDKICAGYNSPQKSLCYNEEGAPLMCVNDRGEWELQGILSYHSNCGRGSHPSIFSSITPVSDWIRKTVGNSFERRAIPVTKR